MNSPYLVNLCRLLRSHQATVLKRGQELLLIEGMHSRCLGSFKLLRVMQLSLSLAPHDAFTDQGKGVLQVTQQALPGCVAFLFAGNVQLGGVGTLAGLQGPLSKAQGCPAQQNNPVTVDPIVLPQCA